MKLKKGLAFSAALLAVACLFETGQPVGAASEKLSTKVIDGKKNYGIYSSLKQVKVKTGKGKKKKTKLVWKFGKKMATTKEFKLAHVQSRSYKLARGRRYYYVYVDGRGVGYVSERAFARSKMSLVKSVSLVNNKLDTNVFVTTDAINYVTDKHGSVVDVNAVRRSADRIYEKNQAGMW